MAPGGPSRPAGPPAPPGPVGDGAGDGGGNDQDTVVIGRVIRAHGIRGEVVVHPLTDVPGRFADGATVTVANVPRTIATTRWHQGRLLVRFDGVDDRSGAERLRGHAVSAPHVELPESLTYWVAELVGMAVQDESGRPLGVVVAAIELPDAAGYDLLEVQRTDGSTWLLPAVEDYVEVRSGRDGGALVLVDPPAGLTDGS